MDKDNGKNIISELVEQENLEKPFTEEEKEVFFEMAKAGVFYGHKKSRRNPHFENYVFSSRSGVELIDIVKTVECVNKISEFIKKSIADKKTFLVVGVQPAARDAVMKLADKLGCSYVVDRWIGGTVTNFPVIGKRIEYFKKRRGDLESGALNKYTKKEKLNVSREIDKMNRKFSGIENLSGVPDILFVIDASLKGHKTAINEARIKNADIIGIIDNDDNPGDFKLFVPANDHAKSSIDWVVNKIISNL